MSYPILVYAVENNIKKEYNVLGFFNSELSQKNYVIIEFPNSSSKNTIIPFLVNDTEKEQELELLTNFLDKTIVKQYCQKNLDETTLIFAPSEEMHFLHHWI